MWLGIYFIYNEQWSFCFMMQKNFRRYNNGTGRRGKKSG